MDNDRWWANQEHEIGEIENTDKYVVMLAARLVREEWEYAAVMWRWRTATLLWSVKGGILTKDADE